MSNDFQAHKEKIVWRIHFKSPPTVVYEFLATDAGRAKWWAESAVEDEGHIEFLFENNVQCKSEIYSKIENEKFVLNYFGSKVSFLLEPDQHNGTDLTLFDEIAINEADRIETTAGWVSALMALKAAVDYKIDLRNHDSKRTWHTGYCDN